MNLKNETLSKLKSVGHKPDEIIAVIGYDYSIPLDNFWELADTEYYNGYGEVSVAIDLKIIGDGWWLERRTYDGSEWWDYRENINMNLPIKKIKALTVEQSEKYYPNNLANSYAPSLSVLNPI